MLQPDTKRPHGSTTDERHNKLTRLGKEAYVSRSGINKLLSAVAAEGLPEAYSRATQYRARKTRCNTATPFGRLVVQKQVTLKTGL